MGNSEQTPLEYLLLEIWQLCQLKFLSPLRLTPEPSNLAPHVPPLAAAFCQSHLGLQKVKENWDAIVLLCGRDIEQWGILLKLPKESRQWAGKKRTKYQFMKQIEEHEFQLHLELARNWPSIVEAKLQQASTLEIARASLQLKS